MKLLVTGFEPFGGTATNISWQVAEQLPAQIGEVQLFKQYLPVSFLRAPIALNDTLQQIRPDVVLMLGQCAEGDKVRLERFAMNMMDSVKCDNDGFCPNEEPIYSNEPLALRTKVNVKHLVAICQEQKLPTMVSNSAGLYVCNRVYYEALRGGHKALFVHLPKNMDVAVALNIVETIIVGLKFHQ